MGGEQAAGVLAIVQEEQARARGVMPDRQRIAAMQQMTRQKFEEESSPYYATARLWDDGIIDPADTRRVLGLGLSASLNAPIEERTRFGVFRM
jgi:3-methylcrotonyl-CoA carboxylase beta subunit